MYRAESTHKLLTNLKLSTDDPKMRQLAYEAFKNLGLDANELSRVQVEAGGRAFT